MSSLLLISFSIPIIFGVNYYFSRKIFAYLRAALFSSLVVSLNGTQARYCFFSFVDAGLQAYKGKISCSVVFHGLSTSDGGVCVCVCV
jgi:hypothetical protein